MVLHIFTFLKLVDKVEDSDGIMLNNLTLINLFLIKMGPMSEIRLTKSLLVFQILCTCIAFLIRYPMASYFYDVHIYNNFV